MYYILSSESLCVANSPQSRVRYRRNLWVDNGPFRKDPFSKIPFSEPDLGKLSPLESTKTAPLAKWEKYTENRESANRALVKAIFEALKCL